MGINPGFKGLSVNRNVYVYIDIDIHLQKIQIKYMVSCCICGTLYNMCIPWRVTH